MIFYRGRNACRQGGGRAMVPVLQSQVGAKNLEKASRTRSWLGVLHLGTTFSKRSKGGVWEEGGRETGRGRDASLSQDQGDLEEV